MADLQQDSIPTDFAADFNALEGQDKQQQLPQLLEKITSQYPEQLEKNLTAYIVYLLAGGIPLVGVTSSEPLGNLALRPLLDHFTTKLSSYTSTPDLQISLSTTAIRLLAPRVVSFEDADTRLKYLLAGAHQTNEDFTSSARALETINLTSTQRTITDTERANIWIRVARCYLEEDDAVSASASINRAKNVLHNVDTSTTEGKTTRLHFQTAQARILDSQRQFLDASSSYHTLSFEPMIDEDDRLQSLTQAIICVVLAAAGPQRARILARLYKDERSAQLPDFPILEKIFLDRVLEPSEVAAFAAKLAPHQTAKMSDGSTVLEKAVLEHNLLGASRLYANISVDGLGELLGVDGERAMGSAASMIEQGRLRGWIDQIDGVVFFEPQEGGVGGDEMQGAKKEEEGGEKEMADLGVGKGRSELRRWDAAVQGLLAEVENVTTMIQTRDPELYGRVMVA